MSRSLDTRLGTLLDLALVEQEAEAAEGTGGDLGHVGQDVCAEHEPIVTTVGGHHGDAGADAVADGLWVRACPSGSVMRAGGRSLHAEDGLEYGGDAGALQTGQPDDLAWGHRELDVLHLPSARSAPRGGGGAPRGRHG